MMNKRLGETLKNNFGSTMMVVGYRGALDIDVWFSEYDWIAEGVQYGNFKRGNVKCPYERRTYGVGFIGEGKYEVSENGKHTKAYTVWVDMLTRCYNAKFQEKYPTYIGCSVDPIWHNFQNFCAWFEENYYELGENKMCLDKDILVRNNKIYSPSTCVFTPNNINVLFIKSNALRGDLPIGVTRHGNKYKAQCHNGTGKQVQLGTYDTEIKAFESYKQFKENHIKEMANKYKEQIPSNLYEAMMNYEVEITD